MSATVLIGSLRAFVEGYPEGGRIPRHSHAMDQLALITQSAAVIETDTVYVVHPLLKALWLPAGVEHSVYSPRPFVLHSLYFPAGSLRVGAGPEVLGLDNLMRELVLFLCAAPRPSQRDTRHENALALLSQLLPLATAESFALPRRTVRGHESLRITWRPIRRRVAHLNWSWPAARACGRLKDCSSRKPV